MKPPLFDPDEVLTALTAIVEPDTVFEVRALDARIGHSYRISRVSGFFNSRETCLNQLKRLTAFCGIYITLNPVRPALLARRANRLDYVAERNTLTGDQHIVSRRCIIVDVDPVRPSGISATDAEKKAAWEKAQLIVEYLRSHGWPEPFIIADSGNGYHLIWRVNLPANDGGLIQRLLNALADHFDDDTVIIDRDVFNPSRIGRLYGTLAAKGDDIPERPHRLSKMVCKTEPSDALSVEQLEAAIKGLTLDKPESDSSTDTGTTKASFDMEAFLANYRIEVADKVNREDGSIMWVLEECPFNSDHTSSSAAVFQGADGKLGFNCKHVSCSNKHWKDFREHFEPPPSWTRPLDPSSTEVRGQIIAILTNAKLSLASKRIKIANAVVGALAQRGQFFFDINQRDFASAMFFDRDRKRLEVISRDTFHAWLSDWLRINRADPIFTHIIREIETVALSEKYSKGIVPDKFWASRPGAIYLSNGDAALVKITAGAVALMDNGTDEVLFPTGNTLTPWRLVEPQDPFETCQIFRGVNCTSSHGQDLLRAVIFSLPTDPFKKPPVCLVGPWGSGKTREAEGIAELYGLSFIANNISEIGDDDFWVSSDAGGLFTLDNCDSHVKWLADAVAAHATGGHREKRKLYTDAEKIRLRAKAWLCLTTANPTFASDAGLADRLLVVRMERRTDDPKDEELSTEIRQHRDAGLSFIVQTLSRALADMEPVPANLNMRHPDFAVFAVRIGRVVDREEAMITALKLAEKDKIQFCFENDYIVSALLDYLAESKIFIGTAADLRAALIENDIGFVNKDGKPSARTIARRLVALWPYLTSYLPIAKKERIHGTLRYTFNIKNAKQGCNGCSK